MKKAFRINLFWPSFLIAFATVMLAVGVQFYAALEADRTTTERSKAVVANGLTHRIAELARRPVAQVVWDDAVRYLDNDFNLEWAEVNIGKFLADMDGFDAGLVLDRDDKPIYAMLDGATVDVAALEELRRAAAPIVAQVRKAEQERGPLPSVLNSEKRMSKFIVFPAVSRIGDEVFIISALLVEPANGSAMPRTDRSAVMIAAENLKPDFIGAFIRLFLLTDARLITGAAPPEPGRVQVPLHDSAGEVAASLTWAPRSPGIALLRKTLPITLLLIGCLGTLAWLLYRKGSRATQRLIASEARASHLATHNVLTGLPNRMAISDHIGHALGELRRTGGPFALHCIDLDRFKEINDTFGHAAGDELLRAVGHRLKSICGPSDTLAHLGGDEFVVIQRGVRLAEAEAFADRLIEQLCEPMQLAVGQVYIRGSIGMTLVENAATDPAECLRQADLALCRAKEQGRGCRVLFEPDMDAAIRLRRSLQDDLRHAIETDEIWLAYQPQVDLAGRLVGVEALVRWNHPERGAIAPTIFVPLAEESGLIEALGMKVLRSAFADSVRFGGLMVAVNISVAQLRIATFVPHLVALVNETGIDPRCFELEITESLLLGNDRATHDCLKRLREMGFRIALDDFGTGYSSLSYLRRYSVDKIKIDRSFIVNLDTDEEAGAVISAIAELARALSLSVIVEGVETETQRERLADVGCTNFQGYLFGKPGTAEQIELLLRHQHMQGHPSLPPQARRVHADTAPKVVNS